MNDVIKDNVSNVLERIASAAEKTGRRGDQIHLVAVSKLQPLEKIYEAHHAGIKVFGENRVQELLKKISESERNLEWHLVGHLQTNKVNKVIDHVTMIQSVDSLHLIEKISKSGQEMGLTSEVLLQINTSGESSKFGFQPDLIFEACELVESLTHLKVSGLMTAIGFEQAPIIFTADPNNDGWQ